jgi:Fur family peroxide stress response transcriptional regulator
MQHRTETIRQALSEKGLKVTPQRILILEAIYELNNHPSAESILEEVKKQHPNIAPGTVYKVLDTFVKHGLIKKVPTDNGVMRYDGIMRSHHHLYCSECNIIQDYFDQELDALLRDYFKNKNIQGFQIDEMKLEIKGKFLTS